LHLGLVTARARADWQAKRLVQALGAVGTVETIEPSSLRLICGRADERDVLMVLAAERDARRFDAVVLGHLATPRGDLDVRLDAARALELAGVPCLNRVGPMLAAQDKLWTAAILAQAGIPTPLCSSVPRPQDAIVAAVEIGSSVVKPLFGSRGDGQFRCEDRAARARLARAVRTGPFLVQRFISPGGSDYRLFVVGDRVEACVRRDAAEGEWRTNAAQRSAIIPVVPHRTWRDVAVDAARALGLEVAGIDLAVDERGPTVLEVNGFPNFQAIHRATGRDMAPLIAARVAHLARTGRRRPRSGRLRAGRSGSA
jgi:ribosomal protein S6--L-glutamate ligase